MDISHVPSKVLSQHELELEEALQDSEEAVRGGGEGEERRGRGEERRGEGEEGEEEERREFFIILFL